MNAKSWALRKSTPDAPVTNARRLDVPKYDYICHTCKHEFELILFYRELNDPQTCNSCDSPMVERLIPKNIPAHFKGNGWGKDVK